MTTIIAEMTDRGVDRSVKCTGHIDAMIPAFECVHDGSGVAVLVGVPHKEALFKTYSMNFLNERTLKETFFGNYKPSSDIPSVVLFFQNNGGCSGKQPLHPPRSQKLWGYSPDESIHQKF
ncbi:alcohol dehydrogenase 3-like [Solanum tuberosum]|uniref:alcohol dehydrogenase 3-like n=1 Tax=Solanum tuberosum TaxID=4113 RepID=UPI000739F7DD|nr:PREDICTED: alcohol dehydrogenase 3-like [Solanum tuberosum]